MLRVILTLAVLATPTLSVAQELTAEQRTACKDDYEKFCSGTMPGGGRIIACMNKVIDQLSPACKKALLAVEKK